MVVTGPTRPQRPVASMLLVGTGHPHAVAAEGQRRLPTGDSAAQPWVGTGVHFSFVFFPQVLRRTKGNGSPGGGMLIHYDEIPRVFEE